MPAHAAVGVQSLLDEAGLPADARHEPVRLLIRPPPGGPPHLRRGTPAALSMLWDAVTLPWLPDIRQVALGAHTPPLGP